MEITQIEVPHIPSWGEVFQTVVTVPTEKITEHVSNGFMGFISKYWLQILIICSFLGGLLCFFVFSKKNTRPDNGDEMQQYLSNIKT